MRNTGSPGVWIDASGPPGLIAGSMHRRSIIVAAIGWLALAGAARAEQPPELQLKQVWSVEGPGRFDASGLAVRDGRFFVVTDRHNDSIFELEFAGDTARAGLYATFTGPEPYPWIGYLDLEGIAPAPDGGFFLAAEWGFAVFHVPAAGGQARWVTPNVKAAGETVGLFAAKDAYVEGLAVLGEGHFLIACEREPRGLIEVRTGGGGPSVMAQEMAATRVRLPPGRTLDWSDLACWNGRVFALARNQNLVVELVRSADGTWAEGSAWSYADTENEPAHCFTDMTFGQAEGLGVTDDVIYVLIDNNNLERTGRSGDRRTWLFAFENPLRP